METQYAYLLNLICFVPLVGALFIVFFLDKENSRAIKMTATVVAGLDFVLSLPLWFLYKTDGAEFQFVTKLDWIPSVGVQYFFGVDGFSVLLILLTTLLGLIAVYSSFTAIAHREKEYYVFLLLLQVGMLGVFCSLDFILFYVFWEVMLVPMYFLIGVWGGPRKLYAAIKFFLFTLVGSVLMLIGILALYFYNSDGMAAIGLPGLGNAPTFSIPSLYEIAPQVPPELQFWIFLAFFVGFAIKVPMFPFHTWLPDAHVEAPTAGSVILAGVLLKMGTYGFIRLSLPLLPDATIKAVGWIGWLSIVAIIYGALVAMAQKDMKKLVAYSSVSHMGFITLGMFALNEAGLRGSILQMLNHGISTGALFLLVGLIYERRHNRMISEYGGIAKVMPIYAMFFLVITLSSIGLPTLNGFIGEFLILIGAFAHKWWWALFATSGIVLGAGYMLWMYQRVFFGELSNEKNKGLKDLNLREQWTIIPLIILAFWIGLYPKPFLDRMAPTVDRVMERVATARPEAALPMVVHVSAVDQHEEHDEAATEHGE
ncbi:MAG: NADH-quinone oxidoreductase subunit M [Thermoanaerobaculales bacterium]|nr:NADH-quinone oxidoreductase subunit M [Thermoanaerobaculales bacterium]